ncbi:MAG: hypothetical protein FJW56_10115 [Actinobacteria bacterium]|nr:hypothetical protein [Actinomycetota bacterium]
MKKYILFVFIFLPTLVMAQDIRLGAAENRLNVAGAFYDYSDPRYVNISVSIWGYVRFPGKYFVPEQTKLIDLISYAGGPSPDAFLDDVRLLKNVSSESSASLRESEYLTKFDLRQLMEDEGPKVELNKIPRLNAGDIILIPGEPKLYFRDYTGLVLSITSTLISLAILVLNIIQK